MSLGTRLASVAQSAVVCPRCTQWADWSLIRKAAFAVCDDHLSISSGSPHLPDISAITLWQDLWPAITELALSARAGVHL
jgi:hypothetical protein